MERASKNICGYKGFTCVKPKFRWFDSLKNKKSDESDAFINSPIVMTSYDKNLNYLHYGITTSGFKAIFKGLITKDLLYPGISQRALHISDSTLTNTNIDNFLNIPNVFEGIIDKTRFILYKWQNSERQTSCIQVELNAGMLRLSVLYEIVKASLTYIELWYRRYNLALHPFEPGYIEASPLLLKNTILLNTYLKDQLLVPGILLPLAKMTPFNNIGAIAIPTAALATSFRPSLATFRDLESGCVNGFTIVIFPSSDFFRISVSSGTVFTSVSQQATNYGNTKGAMAKGIHVELLQRSDPNVLSLYKNATAWHFLDALIILELSEDGLKYEKRRIQIEVYVIALYDPTASLELKWKARIVVFPSVKSTVDGLPSTTSTVLELFSKVSNIKYKQLGTIIYTGNPDKSSKSETIYHTYDIVQTDCSPVDLRDWVSLTPIPRSSEGQTTGTSLYVFSIRPDSNVKEWLPIIDC